MEQKKPYRENTVRLILFAVVAVLHAGLLAFVVLPQAAKLPDKEPEAVVFKLVDVEEEQPPPPPPPPPEEPPRINTSAVEAAAETMIETEEVPDVTVTAEPVPVQVETPETEEYLPMNRIQDPPELPADLRNAIVYPEISRRAGIEGVVYLELFIDSQGNIRNAVLLRENPEGRGFGDAVMKAIQSLQSEGKRATPAIADGKNVGVRYRYPFRFRLR